MVSGGIDEADILNLRDSANAFGVGTAISSARVLDFSLDIVEIEGRKIAKRGKMSGVKKVIRCPRCLEDKVVLKYVAAFKNTCKNCGQRYEELFENYLKNGKLSRSLPSPAEIKERVLGQLNLLKL